MSNRAAVFVLALSVMVAACSRSGEDAQTPISINDLASVGPGGVPSDDIDRGDESVLLETVDTEIAADVPALIDFMVRTTNRDIDGRGLWRCDAANRATVSYSMARPVAVEDNSSNGQVVSAILPDNIGRVALQWIPTSNDSVSLEYRFTVEQRRGVKAFIDESDVDIPPLNYYYTDELTSVRLGPGLSWRGYSALYDAVFLCTVTNQLQD